jgi:Ser/Thr protein kinase RdoA (MazF antagonist)
LEKYRKLLEKLGSGPSQQPLHMDFVRGNILFDDDKITGILDFEKASLGHVIMDVSRTLAFLLVDCKYKTPEKVRKYFLKSGYFKDTGGKIINLKLMDLLIEMFLTYDFYKFLRHNPYESLLQNQHYLRTRDILINLGVISFN